MNILQTIKSQIPNCITLCNLLCGCIASWEAVIGNLHFAAIFMLFGILFDFCDGLSARLLKVSSPLGKELDSMADLVTSGVAPGFILFKILLHTLGVWASFVALLIPLFAAYRLAKFNLDTRQSHSFLGLPTPSNALVWASVGFCFCCPHWAQLAIFPVKLAFLFSPYGVIALMVLAFIGCVLMVSEIPMFGLKFKNLRWADNKVRFIFLLSSAAIILFFGIIGISLVICWYVILSLVTRKSISTVS